MSLGSKVLKSNSGNLPLSSGTPVIVIAAPSGQRLVMDTNNLTSYDSGNQARGRVDVDGIHYGNEYRGDLLLNPGVRPKIDMSTGDHVGIFGGGAPGVLVILSSGLARLCATENILSNADLSLESFKTTDAVLIKRSTTLIATFDSDGLSVVGDMACNGDIYTSAGDLGCTGVLRIGSTTLTEAQLIALKALL